MAAKGKKLYVGNLPFSTTDDQLREIFRQLGQVASAQIATCRDTGRSKGFGYVEMTSEDEAQIAISQFNGAELAGRPIVVNEFRA